MYSSARGRGKKKEKEKREKKKKCRENRMEIDRYEAREKNSRRGKKVLKSDLFIYTETKPVDRNWRI